MVWENCDVCGVGCVCVMRCGLWSLVTSWVVSVLIYIDRGVPFLE